MKKLKAFLKAISWMDHLDEPDWYRNKRAFVHLVSVAAYGLAAFGFDLQLSIEEATAIGGGLLVAVDLALRKTGRRIDAKRRQQPQHTDEEAATADPPPTSNEARQERQKRRRVGKTTR